MGNIVEAGLSWVLQDSDLSVSEIRAILKDSGYTTAEINSAIKEMKSNG